MGYDPTKDWAERAKLLTRIAELDEVLQTDSDSQEYKSWEQKDEETDEAWTEIEENEKIQRVATIPSCLDCRWYQQGGMGSNPDNLSVCTHEKSMERGLQKIDSTLANLH